jgi:hypothetical protein
MALAMGAIWQLLFSDRIRVQHAEKGTHLRWPAYVADAVGRIEICEIGETRRMLFSAL